VSRDSRRALVRQLLSFGLVGGVGLVVDIVVFNALRTTVFEPHLVHGGPIIAKVISTSIAIVVNWIGNRYWTFRTERRMTSRAAVLREGVEFAVVSLIGAGIALGCLWISHYALGFTSVLDDRFWVFSGHRRGASVAVTPWLLAVRYSLRRSSAAAALSARQPVPATRRTDVGGN
jgi:putative flippase GtrA